VRLEARHDNIVIVAAGVAFYSVLALLPTLFIAVSVYGLYTNASEAERQIDSILAVLPGLAAGTLDTQMRAIADASHASLSVGFALSIGALLWTVSNATRAMVRAVKIAYDQEEERSVLERRVVALALSVAIIVGGVAALAFVAALPIWLKRFDPTHVIVTFGNLRWLLVVGGSALVVGLLYRFAPPRRPHGWRQVMPGVVLATTMWLATSMGFSIYVSSYGSYNETYGALGAAVVLLLWFWFAALAVILGAELNEAVILANRNQEPSSPA
jgi:membrane protein